MHGPASSPGSLHSHHGNDGHAWTQGIGGVRGGSENNLHGNALHDFDEVAGGVFRGQQTKTRSRTRLGSVSKVEMAMFTLPVQRHSG